MANRVVTRVGKDAPRVLQSVLLGRSSQASRTVAASCVNQWKSLHQTTGIHPLAALSSPTTNMRFFSDKTVPPPPTDEEQAATEEAKTEAEAAAAPETEAATDAAATEIPREEQLEAELKLCKDQLLRSLAEAENTRRIAKRDVQDARNFAVKSFAKSMLDVSDNLSRALHVVPEDVRHDKEKNPTLVTLYEGIEMTEVGLMKAFESNGLKKFGQPGEAFDPNIHNAMYEYPDSKKEPGTIGQVIKVGFLLNERVLRPADVGVIKKEE